MPNESNGLLTSPRERVKSFMRHYALRLPNNLQFAIFIFHFSISSRSLLALSPLLLALCSSAPAQTIADKMVATVTNGSRATPDLITYSDLVWQLTLEPGTPFSARPGSEQLNKALRTLEDQLLILQEARKLPPANTPEAMQKFEDQVKQKRDQLVQGIGSRALLEERMKSEGLTAEQLDSILRDRVTIEHDLTEEKIESEIDKFVDNLREQPGTEIVILNQV